MQTTRRRARFARTPAINEDIGGYIYIRRSCSQQNGGANRTAGGVDGAGDKPRVGLAQVPFPAGLLKSMAT